jgi:hypothetical protein
MSAERCVCGATDCRQCYPSQWDFPESKIAQEQWDDALNEVVQTILEYGQYPVNGRAIFSLYEFLLEHRDPSFALEMLVSSLSDDEESLDKRRMRERETVTQMLKDHLVDTEIVFNLAEQIALENK